ncbi:MAG: SsrA-binding protein SmpB [Bacteroidales bacterium]|nr:SsrA-binding protein SmpB [Bacteroidales bacterium]
MASSSINIKNKKATFEYELIDKFTAGIQLTGTEIKSIRAGRASLVDSYCSFYDNELWVRSLHISEYTFGSYNNHEPKRERKLLLNRKELKKLNKKIKERGFSIIPIRLFIDNRGYAKLEIALARGKNTYDKRQSLKQKDLKREIDRIKRR